MYIQVLPEYGLVADPMVGIVTSAGESLSPIIDKVAILEDSFRRPREHAFRRG